jgi:hypothetical protein
VGSEFRNAALALGALTLFAGCSTQDDAAPTTVLSGRVAANGAPLAGIRVVARDVDPSGRTEPQFHYAPEGEIVLAETVTANDGSYLIELPRGWVGLAFEHDDWMRAYRTENTTYERAMAIDVELAPAPAPREFTMPGEGEAAVVLEVPSAGGRHYTRLHIEAGDLVTLDGEPVVGPVVARIDAPDPVGARSLWASSLVASPIGVEEMTAFGLVSVELTANGVPVKVARRATLRWEIDIAPQQVDRVLEAWRVGALHNYSLDTQSGLWVQDGAQVDVVDGSISVERSHFSAGAIGEVPTDAACLSPYDQTIIGLDGVAIGGTPLIAHGAYEASVGSNLDVSVHGNAKVEGTASSSAGAVSVTGNAVVTGGTYTGVPTFVAPVPEDDFTRVRATNNNASIASSLTSGALKLTSSKKVALTEGEYALASLELSGKSQVSCTGTVWLYVGGAIKVSGQATLNADPGCDLVIVSDSASDISFTGGSAMSAVIYAPRASIKFSGNGFGLSGAVVGRTVQVSGTFDFVASDDAFVRVGVCEEPGEEPPTDEGGEGSGGSTSSGGSDDESGDADGGDLPRLPDLPD